MNKSSLVACVVTIGVAVPAGWRALDADIPTDGPKLRPPLQTTQIGDASISLQLDRGAIVSGGTISATLVATSERAHDVKVGVIAYEDNGIGAERVSNPPTRVGDRPLVLHAAPGGGPPVVASFRIAKVPRGHAGWYYIVATGKHASDGGATAGFVAWGGNELGMTFDAPDKVPAIGAFVVAVHVVNTTKQPLHNVTATLGGRVSGPELDNVAHIYGATDFDVEAADELTRDGDSDDDQPLAPGAERTLLYRVVPKSPDTMELTIVAEVDAAVRDDKGVIERTFSAMDVHTFVRPPVDDAPVPVAAR